jgi:hypothetical protein
MQGFFSDSKVVGLVGDELDCGYKALDASDPMADIGTEQVCAPEDDVADAFSAQGSNAGGLYATIAYVHSLGVHKMGFITCTDPPCTVVEPAMESQIAGYGMAPLDVISAALSVPSYLPYVLKAQADGDQAIEVFAAETGLVSVIQAANSIGYHPIVMDSGLSYDQEVLQTLGNLKGNHETVTDFLPFTNPAIGGQMKAVMNKYAPVGWTFDLYGITSWIAAHAAVQDLKGIHGPITRKSVLAGMKKLTHFTNSFLPAPIDFSKLGPSALPGLRVHTYVIYKVTGTTLKELKVETVPLSAAIKP